MVRYNFFTIFILLILCILTTACGKKNVSLYNESSYKNLAKNNSEYKTHKALSNNIRENNAQENFTKRRGLFSIFFKNVKKEPTKLNNNIKDISNQDSFSKNGTIAPTSIKVERKQVINKQNVNKNVNNESRNWKENNIVKSVTSFFNFFSNNNLATNKNTRYPVDVLSVEDGLNIAVIKIPENIPKNEELVFYSENKKLLKSMPNTLPKDISLNIINDQIYYDIFGINNFTESYFHLNSSSKQNNNEELSPSDIYKNYFIALKYEGLLTKYNEVLPNRSLSILHRALISQLLLKKGDSPHVLYMFYRDIQEDSNISSKKHLYLISYLNNIRSYIYSKKFSNFYLQEVQISNLPVDEVLILLKPITVEQYNCLPKQINIFNAKKMSIKTWLEKSKNLENSK